MMKYILSGFGVVILIAGAVFGIRSYQANNIDYQSEKYAEEVLPELTTNWDPDALVARAHPNMMRGTNMKMITQLNDVFKEKLGSYRELKQCIGRAMVVQTQSNHMATTASYHCSTVFEKGNATINLGLMLNENKEWRINNFSVKSALLQQ